MKWWRHRTYDWYFLNGSGPGQGTPGAPGWWKGGYTDWKDWTDLPDFYMVDGAFGYGGIVGQGVHIVDSYGRRYLNVSVGVGLPGLDITYAEGYIAAWNFDSDGPLVSISTKATRDEVKNFLTGFGESVWVSGVLGTGGSISFGGVASLFGYGVPFGLSWTGGGTFVLDGAENSDLSWYWLDYVPKVARSSILLNNESSDCECQ